MLSSVRCHQTLNYAPLCIEKKKNSRVHAVYPDDDNVETCNEGKYIVILL